MRSVFVLPSGGSPAASLYDLPFPSDLRRLAGAGVDLSGFPNRADIPLIDDLVRLLRDQVDGFSTYGTMYARFTGAIDESLLPDPETSVAPGSSVFLVDLATGERAPLQMRLQPEATDYWAAFTLAARAVDGFVLRPATTYAFGITSALLAVDGSPIEPADDLRKLIEGDQMDDAAAEAVYGPALERLRVLDLQPNELVSLAVFTTMDPVSPMLRAAQALRRDVALPEVTSLASVGHRNGYTTLIGRYEPAPFYQAGEEPFDEPGSGEILFADGEPVLQREDELRFALAVPDAEMPKEGFPLVIYSHGTGGDYESFFENGTAARLAHAGIASIGFDQVLHGPRAPEGTAPETAFFNFLNPVAGRDNNRQSALDNVQQARLAQTMVVPENRIEAEHDVHFDPDRVAFVGHSQGGLNGSLFLAIDDSVRGGVLSGSAGGLVHAILFKTEPTAILPLLAMLLDLDPDTERFDIFHPLLMVVQTFIDPGDPLSFASHWYREPRAGSGRSVLQTEGLQDEFAPPPGTEALAVAGRLPLVNPVSQPIAGLELMGLPAFDTPVAGNVQNVDGVAFTAGLVQVANQGHFALFDDEGLQATFTEFVQSLLDEPPGTIDRQ